MITPTRISATLLVAAALFAAPLAAFAQDSGPEMSTGIPSYAQPIHPSDEETIKGRILSFDGQYRLQVRDDRGFIDDVQMHQGTIINPTGLTLSPGMSVTIYGVNQGKVLAANQIDTPYRTYGAVVVPGPYYYPAYPFAYGPAFGFGIGFGGPGWYGRYWR
jgi:hypothetical protein